MKKPGNRGRRNWQKRWLLRKARRKFIASSRGPCQRISPAINPDRRNRAGAKKAANRGVKITLPARLDFEENYEETTDSFQLIRKAWLAGHRIKKLRFHNIRNISPAAALVLASEVDQWSQRVGGRIRAEDETWDYEIKRLLCEMGYFELLKLPRPVINCQPGNLTFLKFIRGDSENRDSGKLAKQLRVNIEAITPNEIKRHSLFEGLSEAITNVVQHAYPEATASGRRKQWWLSASYNRQERELIVMFYDQGAGIPATLPHKWPFFETVRAAFYYWTDSKKIEAAAEYGRSATFRPERGKGLRNLVEFARAYDKGKLSIYSLRGLYKMSPTPQGGMAGTRRDHVKSIGGTLIEWSVKL